MGLIGRFSAELIVTYTASSTHAAVPDHYARYTLLLLSVLLIGRLAAIMLSPLDLGPDEAQYWRWGQTFEWGYYSKPPLIAWLIGSVTHIFGDSSWAVRLPAPLLHTITAGLIFSIARRMEDARTGFYAVLIYILMPGVTFSSGVMTTDSVLFVFWALALGALWQMRAGGASWRMSLGLGLAIGAGFLAKYAMIYFVIGIALTLLIDRPTRQAFNLRNSGLVIFGALAVLAPHIGWNLAHDLQTLSHTADNANWGADLFHPENAVKFLVDQMGVFGPVSFLTLLAGIGLTLRSGEQTPDSSGRWLLCFFLPVLLIILGQAITSRAHANWAATAYVTASLFVARWMASDERLLPPIWLAAAGAIFIAALYIPDLSLGARGGLGGALALLLVGAGFANGWRVAGLLWASTVLHAVAALVFTTLAAGPTWLADEAGLANAFKRTRGWTQTAVELSDIATQTGATSLLVDERENWHGLDFYGAEVITQPIHAWQRYNAPKSYADLHPLPEGAAGPVLIASVRRRFRTRMRADFERIEEIGYLDIALGGGTKRRFKLYLGYGYTPLARTPDWDARFAGQVED